MLWSFPGDIRRHKGNVKRYHSKKTINKNYKGKVLDERSGQKIVGRIKPESLKPFNRFNMLFVQDRVWIAERFSIQCRTDPPILNSLGLKFIWQHQCLWIMENGNGRSIKDITHDLFLAGIRQALLVFRGIQPLGAMFLGFRTSRIRIEPL